MIFPRSDPLYHTIFRYHWWHNNNCTYLLGHRSPNLTKMRLTRKFISSIVMINKWNKMANQKKWLTVVPDSDWREGRVLFAAIGQAKNHSLVKVSHSMHCPSFWNFYFLLVSVVCSHRHSLSLQQSCSLSQKYWLITAWSLSRVGTIIRFHW